MIDDVAVRAVVARLSRPHPSGGVVIERAAILAEGADAQAVVAWIDEHGGKGEMPPTAAGRGLHSERIDDRNASSAGTPRRYVLPAGLL